MRVAFHNLGCKVNSYETELMEQLFRERGYRQVSFGEFADVYVVNTCTVTSMADAKSRQMLHKAKKQNPDSVVIAVGCYVQAAGEKLLQDSAVDICIGNNNKTEIVDIFEGYYRDKNKNFVQSEILGDCDFEESFLKNTGENTRAYIKIQDGCDQFCSYCIIPYARGRVRSRKKNQILDEVKYLLEKGTKEFVLTGIHISSYGKDIDESLQDLLKSLNNLEGSFRLRLGSLEPKLITESFVQAIAEYSRLCPHFHLSLQSGCDATLKRMNRHYTTGEYANSVGILRRYFDRPAITTDIITGFPGETAEEFEETFRFVEAMNFYETHIFKYSVREGTVAAGLPNQCTEEEKSMRSKRLLELCKNKKQEYLNTFLGQKVTMLTEQDRGFTERYCEALVPKGIGSNEFYTGTVVNIEEGIFILN